MDTITEKSKTSVAKFEDFFSTEYKDAIFKALEKYPDERSVVVDYLQLEMFDPDLADLLIEKPEEVIKAAGKAIKNIDTTRKNADLNVRFQNLSNIIPLRDLRSKYIGKFVAVDGIIRKTNEIRPRIINAMFECRSCMRLHEVPQKSNLVSEPALCNDCGGRSFRLLQEESEFLDTQTTRLQEPLENLSGGEQPRQINVVLEDDLVDTITPGDIIRITGTLKTVRDEKTKLFKNYIYCNYIEALEQEFEELQISEEDEEKIKELAKNPDVYNKIINSTAPSIQGYREVKEAIALQLFGGAPKELEDKTRIRGDIHILIVGDPGIGKSQMLKYVSKLAPRGIYTSGKGTSGVGLCVAPESLIFTEEGAFEIGEFARKNLTKPIEYKPEIYVSTLKKPIKIQTINSTKLSSKVSDKIWKLKAPEKLVKITTQTRKELILTPETKVLSFENGELRWMEAKRFEENNHVATTRKLEHRGQNVLTLELIKDIDNVVVYGAKPLVKKFIKKIKKEKSIRELAQELGVNENLLYHNWTNENARGNINLKILLKLSKKTSYSLEKLSDKIQGFSQYHGHSIKLPKYLNERFLYFAGLIAGDGDIRITPRGGYSIRFSNSNKELREKFKSIVGELFGIEPEESFQKAVEHKVFGHSKSEPSNTECLGPSEILRISGASKIKDFRRPQNRRFCGISKERVPSIRFHSKIIAHILNRLGIPESPKSNRLDISEIIFSLPDKELAAFIRGLFDSDGTVVISDNGSSSIEFYTASEKLAKKLQLALLRFGIIAHLRKRGVKGEITEIRGKKVIKRNDQYVIRISGETTEKFGMLIGFEHPKKKNKLQELLSKRRKQKIDTNIDVIPGIGETIKEIRSFYGISVKGTYGSNFGHLVEKGDAISRKSLQKVIGNLKSKASIENIKIEIPDEIRSGIGKLSSHEELKLNKMAFYDYFRRKGRNTKVPFNILVEPAEHEACKISDFVASKAKLLKAVKHEVFGPTNLRFVAEEIHFPRHSKSEILKVTKRIKDKKVRASLALILSELQAQEETIREKLQYLESLAYSDILFEKIKKVEIINSPYNYVYDLTVEKSHSFIANGIVVHNTAAAVKDDLGGWSLEAGALVLGDRGNVCVDELDKMRSEDRSAIHEALEQQTISIAKAGIMATLNSRCAMLAAANPKFGRFDRYKSIAEQINLPAPILSRFDLIFIVEDKPNAERDKKLAGHILNIHKNTSIPFEIDPELLRKYIAYARKQTHPQLTQGAIEVLQEFYVGMRGSAEDDDSPVPITARQLEALVRLSEANCKIRLGKEVTAEDAKRAIRLQQECMKQVGMDPETGKVDIDKVEGRTPKSERDKARVLLDIIKELSDEYGGRVPVSILTGEMSDRYNVSEDKVMEIINKLKQQGLIFEPQAGYLKTV
jgi:replicative DNA helicase Mcm